MDIRKRPDPCSRCCDGDRAVPGPFRPPVRADDVQRLIGADYSDIQVVGETRYVPPHGGKPRNPCVGRHGACPGGACPGAASTPGPVHPLRRRLRACFRGLNDFDGAGRGCGGRMGGTPAALGGEGVELCCQPHKGQRIGVQRSLALLLHAPAPLSVRVFTCPPLSFPSTHRFALLYKMRSVLDERGYTLKLSRCVRVEGVCVIHSFPPILRPLRPSRGAFLPFISLCGGVVGTCTPLTVYAEVGVCVCVCPVHAAVGCCCACPPWPISAGIHAPPHYPLYFRKGGHNVSYCLSTLLHVACLWHAVVYTWL